VDWVPILPPVVLEHWPAHIDPACQRFSTVGDWRGSQYAVFEGESYSGKRREFLRFLLVPRKTRQPVEPALYVGFADSEDLELLLGNKWLVHDPFLCAGDPHSYREFIRYSRAEFSVAKGGYVKSNSGWVSDRTACYLASGKPALVQATGFERQLPTGLGLLTFRTLEEAVAGVEAINGDYLSHCQAARRLAEERFNSDVVLGSVLERVGLGGDPTGDCKEVVRCELSSWSALAVLGRVRRQEAKITSVPGLIKSLRTSDPDVRNIAATVLGKYGSKPRKRSGSDRRAETRLSTSTRRPATLWARIGRDARDALLALKETLQDQGSEGPATRGLRPQGDPEPKPKKAITQEKQ
jgi:hypothetical protein